MTSVARDSGGVPINRTMITVTAMMATTVVLTDMTISSIALPHMQGGLSATQDRIGWVMTTYFVALAIMTACTGWLAGRFGRKRVYLTSLAAFAVFAICSANASSLPEIMIYRSLQGMCAAPIVPISQALMLDSYPRERHGEALAVWGTGVMFAPVIAPVVGGWLTDSYGWQWVFYLGTPFAMIALLVGVTFIPETARNRDRKFDWFGFVTLAAVLGALQLFLDRGEYKGWFGSTEIVIEAAIVGLGLYLFVVHTLTTNNPFVSLAIIKDRNIMLGLLFMFLLGVCVLSMNVLLPLYMQNLRGFPVFTAGLLMAPRGAGTLVSLLVAGYLVRFIDGRWIIAAGFACVAYSAWDLSTFTPDVGELKFIVAGTFNGMGIGFIWVPLVTIAFATLPVAHRTEASTLTSLFRSYGSGAGVSIVMTILSRTRSVKHAELVEHVTPFHDMMRQPFLPDQWDIVTPSGLQAIAREIAHQASAIAFVNDFALVFVGALACIPLVLLLSRDRPQDRITGSAAE